jgi:MFS family permease
MADGEQLGRNPALLCLIRAMQMALFPMAILSVFLQREIGFGVAEIMLLQGVFGLAMVLFEFPSGYLADRIGYRRCLIIAFSLWTVAWPIYGHAQGWLGVASAELLLGVGMAMISGADTALLYESLLARQRQDTFMKWVARLTFSGEVAEGLAALVAGLLFATATALPFWAQGLASAVALVLALALVEPER